MVSNQYVINISLTGEDWINAMQDLKLMFPMKNINQIGKDIIAEYYRQNREEIERLKSSLKSQVELRASNSAQSNIRITESGSYILDTTHGPVEVIKAKWRK